MEAFAQTTKIVPTKPLFTLNVITLVAVLTVLDMSCLLMAQQQYSTTNADAVFARVQQQFSESESIRAQFFTRTPDTKHILRGVLLVKKGSKFALDLNGRIITCNGKTVWNYEPAQKKVIVSDFKNTPSTISPEKLFLSFPKTYKPNITQESAAEGRLLRLTLDPSTPRDAVGGMQQVVMRLAPETLRLRELLIYDGSTVYQWTMTELKLQASLKDEQFEFTPPKGTQVIDLRD
jgi:outer membrane lipoprotein-sorting protein